MTVFHCTIFQHLTLETKSIYWSIVSDPLTGEVSGVDTTPIHVVISATLECAGPLPTTTYTHKIILDKVGLLNRDLYCFNSNIEQNVLNFLTYDLM